MSYAFRQSIGALFLLGEASIPVAATSDAHLVVKYPPDAAGPFQCVKSGCRMDLGSGSSDYVRSFDVNEKPAHLAGPADVAVVLGILALPILMFIVVIWFIRSLERR